MCSLSGRQSIASLSGRWSGIHRIHRNSRKPDKRIWKNERQSKEISQLAPELTAAWKSRQRCCMVASSVSPISGRRR